MPDWFYFFFRLRGGLTFVCICVRLSVCLSISLSIITNEKQGTLNQNEKYENLNTFLGKQNIFRVSDQKNKGYPQNFFDVRFFKKKIRGVAQVLKFFRNFGFFMCLYFCNSRGALLFWFGSTQVGCSLMLSTKDLVKNSTTRNIPKDTKNRFCMLHSNSLSPLCSFLFYAGITFYALRPPLIAEF